MSNDTDVYAILNSDSKTNLLAAVAYLGNKDRTWRLDVDEVRGNKNLDISSAYTVGQTRTVWEIFGLPENLVNYLICPVNFQTLKLMGGIGMSIHQVHFMKVKKVV